jgi:hypothetical protein
VALFLIYLIFFVAFFGNSLTEYNLIPPHFTLVTEVSVYLLFIYSLILSPRRYERYSFHLLPVFAFFAIVAFCSVLVNKLFSFLPLLSLRLIFRFYLFYLAILNLGLSDRQYKKINAILFVIFILQLPASAIKFYFFGVSEETIGTYGVRGGGMTTMIPIIALGYLAGFHFFYKPRLIYWFLGVAFILYGIVGAKAALLFLLPATFLGLYYIIYVQGKRVSAIRAICTIPTFALLSIAVGFVIIKYNPRLNPERKVGGSVDLSYALEYSQQYTESMYDRQFGGGRVATTKLAFNQVLGAGLEHAFFGYGPGSLTESVLNVDKTIINTGAYRIARSYGKSGLVIILVEYGLFGSFLLSFVLCLLIRASWKAYK